MQARWRPPAGPRGIVGASAEDAAALYLQAQGWRVLARNVRVGRDELDILALEPGAPEQLVLVEVRSGSTTRFGSPRESVDARKVARLYRARTALQRGALPDLATTHSRGPWRVDLITLVRASSADWCIEAHLRGLEPA